ncbi:MAG: hypothetical protein O7G87_00720 [bacterium]|nr:hypothetical protein [bacterium]
MARWKRFWTMAVLLGLLGSSAGYAQEYFGKNKVNYTGYDWHYIESEHFIIYFDVGSQDLAEFVAKESERSLVQIEKTLKYTMKQRYPIVIYNSHNGFSVTNITGGEGSEFTGGFTEFAQGRVVIPFTGSYEDLRHVIHHELVHSVTIELWTGGGWLGSLVTQTATLPPLWIAEGIAEYVSQGGWVRQHDNFMRDATITGYVPTIEMMSYSYFAYPGGNSVFYMVEQEYGKDKVAEFISSFKTAKTPDKALKASLGFGLEELDEKWHLWLKRQYWNEINMHNTPGEIAKNLTDREEGRNAYNVAPTFSPQGDKIAYLSDQESTFDIHLMSAIDGKALGRLVEGEKSSDFESMFVLRPGFTWSPDGRQIAFAAKSNNKNTLYILEVKKKKIRKRFKFDLDGLFEPTWSPDGKRIAVAGIKDGWSDIFIVNLDDDSLTRVTSDPYDERHLEWSPNGEWIAMSSDRPDTNLVYDGKKDFSFGQYDIFVLRPDGTEIRRVVANDEADDRHPAWGANSKELAYVSDRTGVGNIYIANLDSVGVVHPITNLLSSAQYIDWSADGKKITFTAFNKGALDIFVLKNPAENRKSLADLPMTRLVKRIKGIDEKTFVERQKEQIKAEEEMAEKAEEKEAEEMTAEAGDSTSVAKKEEPEQKVEQWISDQTELAAAEAKANGTDAENGEEDTDDGMEPSDSPGLKNLGEREFTVKKYKIKFKPELFGAQAGFDTFYGVSSFVTLSMSDVMGDHRATLLTSLNFSLKDSYLLFSYEYLKRQTNYTGQLFHFRSYFYSNNILHADRFFGVAGTAEKPFNRFSRAELSARFISIDRERLSFTNNPFIRGGFNGIGGERGTRVDRLGAAIGEMTLVTDTTLRNLFGPVDGRRARLSFEGSGVGMKFATFQLDYRKYIRMLREYTLSIRLAGGTSYGRNSSVFFIGGVNNPVNPTFSTIAQVDQSRLFLSNYIWPLRGADLLEMAGNSFVLTNVSFRFPLIRQLAMGWPLPFYFQNVEGELFMDVGSAFERGNFDPWEQRDGGFELRDLVAGYGFGVRVNLGYFLFRYDIAWPTDFAESFHPKQYFSIDFTGMF